jgi:trk system potassium uptake protein TrkA
MKVIIVGGGETAVTLTNLLDKDDVTIIEKDDVIAKALANRVDALVINGDGTDISIMKEAGLAKAGAVIAATSDDSINVMVCQIAKSENIPKIIPLVRNPKNEELFTKLGITSIVSVAGESASTIKKMLRSFGDARIIAQLGGGKVEIMEQVISKKSRLVGRKASISKAVIAAIYREGELAIPNSKSTLKEGDVLLVAAKTKDMKHVLERIKGE